MSADVDVAAVAALLADRTRSTMLDALLDGRARSAGELARYAGVAPSTASAHLRRLVEGGLLAVRRAGRHRYYALAGPEVARAMEAPARLAPPARPASLRQAEAARALRFARTCYDHLAGTLGVALTEALVREGTLAAVADGYAVTPSGARRLESLGIRPDDLRRTRRAFAPACLDGTERRYHVAGALGAALLSRLLELGWLRRGAVPRTVHLTPEGRCALSRQLGLALDAGRDGPAAAR